MVRLRLAAALVAAAAFVACGGDSAPVEGAPDVTPASDMTPEADATTEADAASEADATTCEHACLDEQGRNDRRLCPSPVSDWNCVAGCCVAVFKCDDDDDCRTEGYALGQCKDDRFDCRCDVPTGVCGTWYCGVDADCGEGQFCVSGACAADPGGELSYRSHGPSALRLPVGYRHQVLVDATRATPDGGLIVLPAEVVWTSGAPAVATVAADGVITAVTAGDAQVTARVGAATVATISVSVLPVDQTTGLTVLLRSTSLSTPLAGVWALVDAGGQTVHQATIPADGLLHHPGELAGNVDLHIFADHHDWVSWTGLVPGAVLDLPVAPAAYGRIELDPAGAIVADSTRLDHVGLIRGTPDFGNYSAEGAFEVVLTSTRLGTALFDFSLPALLGADVKRYLHPDHNIPRVSAADSLSVPGGVVFNLAGPAIPDYTLTAPEGKPGVWTLGGRLDLNEISEYSGTIVDALSGGNLDFTQIVGAIFPLFRNFWSGYSADVVVGGLGDVTQVTRHDARLTTPMTVTTAMVIPPLPRIGELGWADALFLLGGALTPDGAMVPLGLNGGADTANKETDPADGRADGDPNAAGVNPFPLPMAPLHAGLSGPHSRFITVAAAVSIPGGGSDPRPSAGSVIMTRHAPGVRPPARSELPAFLGFPESASFDPATRTLRWASVEGADLQRILVKGKRGRHWTIYGAFRGSAVLPAPATFGVEEDRLTLDAVESVLINSLDFANGVDASGLGVAGGIAFDLLLGLVDRVSFLDVKNTRPPADR